MADNKINITVSANTKKNITVTSSQVSTEITASTDTGRFWAQTSKNWAISDVIVDNTDYSSKHYAQEAKTSAQNASNYEVSTRETYNSFLETSANAVTEIQGVKEETLTEIDNSKTNAVDSINTVKNNAVDSINSTKTTILSDIEFVADGEKEEIKDLADVIKDNANTVNTAIEAGVERLNSIDALKNNQITNCILEIPQRIKYTLENGTLTIKAGSVVIVPYGVEDLTNQYPKGATFINDNFKVYDTQFEDGKFFVWAELVSDITGGFDVAEQNIKRQVFISLTEASVGSTLKHISGDNPTTTTATWTLAYNTSTNLVGRTNNNTVFNYTTVDTLPIMHVVSTTHAYGSIDQVFNGMGCIGSHKWLDKGVKILCANGKNEDGTLKNLEVTTQKFSLYTGGTANARYEDFYDATLGYVARISQIKNTFVVNSLSELDDKAGAYAVAYVIPENKFYVHASNEPWGHFIGAQVSYHTNTNSDGTVSEFTPYTPFRAVDYNDYRTEMDVNNAKVSSPITALCTSKGTTTSSASSTMPAVVIQNYVSGTSWYRVWSDGWIEQGGRATKPSGSGVQYNLLKKFSNTNYCILGVDVGNTNANIEVAFGSLTVSTFKIFNNGKHNISWYACGY